MTHKKISGYSIRKTTIAFKNTLKSGSKNMRKRDYVLLNRSSVLVVKLN